MLLSNASHVRISTENHRKSGPTNQLNVVAWSGILLSRSLSLRWVTAHGEMAPCFTWAFSSLGANPGNISVCASAVQCLHSRWSTKSLPKGTGTIMGHTLPPVNWQTHLSAAKAQTARISLLAVTEAISKVKVIKVAGDISLSTWHEQTVPVASVPHPQKKVFTAKLCWW